MSLFDKQTAYVSLTFLFSSCFLLTKSNIAEFQKNVSIPVVYLRNVIVKKDFVQKICQGRQLFVCLEVVYRLDRLDDFRSRFDVLDDLFHTLVGHRTFIKGSSVNSGRVDAFHFLFKLFE